jgi:hypothetical protein
MRSYELRVIGGAARSAELREPVEGVMMLLGSESVHADRDGDDLLLSFRFDVPDESLQQSKTADELLAELRNVVPPDLRGYLVLE